MLHPGQLIPNFRLWAANQPRQVGPWDYKQHRNLVLIFFRSLECLKCKELLREISEHYHEYQQMEAEVLAISSDEINYLRQRAQELAAGSKPKRRNANGSIDPTSVPQSTIPASARPTVKPTPIQCSP